jgi:hypothetical protein
MADYYDETIVQPTIPDVDMTALERLLLTNIFQCEFDNDGWYFFAEQGPSTFIEVTHAELEEALAQSREPDSAAHLFVAQQIADGVLNGTSDQDAVELDASGTSWEAFFQDIVKRSKTLTYVTILTAFTCSKMRPDGFGGAATLITAKAVKGKSTNDIIEDFLAEERIDP